MDGKCIVKITIGNKHEYFTIDDVIYYRSGMSPDFITRWLWYFEYLQSIIKVAYPRRQVILTRTNQDIMLGKEWHEFRRLNMIKSRKAKLKKIENIPINIDLFGFEKEDKEAKKAQILNEIEMLEKDIFPIPEFPEYINKIKKYLTDKAQAAET